MFICKTDLNLGTYNYKEVLIYLTTWWTFKSHIECMIIFHCTGQFLCCIPDPHRFKYQYCPPPSPSSLKHTLCGALLVEYPRSNVLYYLA